MGYNTGRAYCLPIFFFLCFGTRVLKKRQKKTCKVGKRAGYDFS